MMRFTMFLLLVCNLLTARITARAQDSAGDLKPYQAFPVLFPNPTGANGYEELVLAGDLLRNNGPLNYAMQPDATLTMKRNALDEPEVKRGLALLRAAFTKPIISPRDPAKMSFSTVFPDMANFRNLARVYSMEEYVALADGRTDRAIDAMDACLRLSRVIPPDSLIAALVFVAVDAIAVKQIAIHVPQMSFHDCERLQKLCEDYLRDTNSFEPAFASERIIAGRLFTDTPPEPNIVLNLSGNADGDEPPTPEETALKAQLEAHPENVKKIWQQAQADIDGFYDRMLIEVKKEAWERKPVVLPNEEPAVKALTDGLLPTMGLVLSKQDQNRANLHLLGTFAALQRYRWIYNGYPKTLKELRLPYLTQDPFTGESLLYKPGPDSYDLHSAGAVSEGSAARTPVYLPYRSN